jgi:hypothetical protein
MSLLNDALKRASESDRNRPRPAEPRTALRSASEPRGQSLALAMVVGSIFALGLAGWFFWQLWGGGHLTAPPQVEPAQLAVPQPAPVIHLENPPPQIVAAPPTPLAPPASTLSRSPVALAPAKPIGDGWPVALKLMGIFFRPTNPRALISGRTVSVGDEIEGIRVTKIENDRVTVEWNGKVKELKVNGGGF